MAFDRLLADLRGMQDAPPEEDRFARDQGMEEFLLRQYGNRAAPEVAAETGAKSGSREGGSYLAMAARLGAPIAGSVLGALSPVPGGAYLGGAVGSAAGEAVGEWLDGQPLDPQEIALQGVVGGIPFAGKASSIAGGALLRGAEGAALGAGSELAREALHGQAPDTGAILRGAALGGAFGAVGGGVEGYFAARAARAAQDGADVVTDLAHQRAAQHEAIDQAYQQTTDELLGTLPPGDRALYDAYREGRLTLVKPDGTPLDEELFARLEPIRQQHEEATQAWEAAKGWLPEQQGAARAANSPDPQAAFEEGAKEAEQAQLRRRVVTDRTPGDAAADTAFEQADHQRQIAADARAVAQVAEHVEPSLGQLGLPGPGETSGALSAADPEHLAPSIIDHINAPEDVRTMMNTLAEQSREQIGTARRGMQTRADREAAARPIIAELADRLGTDPDRFQATLRKRGEAVNAEQMEALKVMLNGAASDFAIAAKQAAANPDDKGAMLRAYKAMTVARSLVSEKAGAAAETGRALAVLRRAEQADVQGVALEKLLKEAGTSPQSMAEIVRRAAMLDDPAELERFMHADVSTGDKIYEAWINGLLSGPRTHVVNNVSNAMALGLRLPEEIASGLTDALRARVTGAPRERFAGEVIADTLGMTRGLVGGARAALKAFDTETSTIGRLGKIESRTPAIGGKLGRVVRLPSRMLQAADEFWKAVGIEGAAHAQAYRQAAQEGLSGGKRLERMASLLTTDRPRLLEQATPEALYRTFQQPGGEVSKALLGMRNAKLPHVGWQPMRWIMPFVRTPSNIVGFAGERTPLGIVPLIAKAAQGTLNNGEAADRIGRMLVGTGMAGAVVMLAGQGQITGQGPTKPGELAVMRNAGWQPYSFRFGDQYVRYDRIEPLGSVLGMAADAAHIMQDPLVSPEDVALRLGFTFAKRMTDQPFFTGLREALDALDDPDGKGAGYMKRLAATAIPTAAAQVAQALDPTARRQQTMTDRLKARLPGMSGDLMPLRNLWGEPIERDGGVSSLLSPIQRQTLATDTASQEMARLVGTVGLAIGAPSATLREKGVTTPLDAGEYDRLSVHAGQIAKAKVTALVRSPGYANLDDHQRADLIDRKFREARDEARAALKVALAMRRRGR